MGGVCCGCESEGLLEEGSQLFHLPPSVVALATSALLLPSVRHNDDIQHSPYPITERTQSGRCCFSPFPSRPFRFPPPPPSSSSSESTSSPSLPSSPATVGLPSSPPLTPVMRQWSEFKRLHPSHVLLFRLGDFYELFHDDARLASSLLSLTLTSRLSIPMCGFPHFSLSTHLRRLLAGGHSVAICDQTETVKDSKERKALIVHREISRIVTRGTALLDDIDGLHPKQFNFLLAIQHNDTTQHNSSTPHTSRTRQPLEGKVGARKADVGGSESDGLEEGEGVGHLLGGRVDGFVGPSPSVFLVLAISGAGAPLSRGGVGSSFSVFSSAAVVRPAGLPHHRSVGLDFPTRPLLPHLPLATTAALDHRTDDGGPVAR